MTSAPLETPASVHPRTPPAPTAPKLPWVLGGLLGLAFALPLYRLATLSFSTELYSHILLIPLVSGYFFWTQRKQRPATQRSATAAMILAGLGVLALGCFWTGAGIGTPLPGVEGLAVCTAAMICFLAAWIACFWGWATLRHFAFPVAFLAFMIPMPLAVEHATELFLQRGSAAVAYAFFSVLNTPVFRDELVFHLPGISLEIAPECSGIRSSLALLITSVVAGQMYLTTPWKRALLAIAVVPLALVRNGVRVVTIGQLCVNVGPHMIDSPIHHHGGPLFFAGSLVPFGLLLLLLVRSERSRSAPH